MRLIDRMRRSEIVERALTPDPSTFMMSTFGGNTGERMLTEFPAYASQGFSGNAIVFSVIHARMRLLSEATFKFRNLVDKHLFGGPGLSLLENPWPGGTTGELLARMEQDVSLAGNAFIARGEDRLIRLRPDWVTIASEVFVDPLTGHEIRQVVGYLYKPLATGEDQQFWPVEDVAHWSPVPDPLAYWRGMSWLTPVLREVNADIALSNHAQSYLDNAATPNLLIRHARKLEPKTVQILSERFAARHGGPSNAGRTVVLDDGADLTVIGNNLAEMNFTAVQSAGEVRIASAGGVPPIVIGLSAGLDAATYSNYLVAMRAFGDLWARPEWRSACASLAKLVVTPADAELWYDVSDISALRDSEADRAARGQTVATSIQNLITAGFNPDSVVAALVADDYSLLKHSGLTSVQLYKPGTTPTAAAQPQLTAGQNDGGTQ